MAKTGQHRQQRRLMRQADRREIAWVLGFGIDADIVRLGERQYLFKGRDFKLPVKRHIVLAQLRQAFLGAQGLEFGQREIFGEPAGHFLTIDGLACLAVGKFGLVGHVGGFRNLILMPRDQYAVFRQDKVRLNIIRTLFNRAGVAGDGVFGPLT